MARPDQPRAPRLDRLTLPPLTGASLDDLAAGEAREAQRLTRTSHGDATWDRTTLRECLIGFLVAGELSSREAHLVESRLEDLAVTSWSAGGATWRDVEVARGRVGSLDLHGGRLTAVDLSGLKLGYVNLRGAVVVDVRFTDCTFEALDLASIEATRVVFEGCSAVDLDVRDARLADVDLRGLELTAVDGVSSLRGATVSERQLAQLAPLMATALGVRVGQSTSS